MVQGGTARMYPCRVPRPATAARRMELAGAGGCRQRSDDAVGKIETSRMQAFIAAGLYLSFVAKSVHYE